jgi:type IV secretory pathway TrbL component
MKEIKKIITLLVVLGNLLFMLWITYNGINEGFAGTLPEKVSYIGLMGLLIFNTILILRSRARQKQ